MRFLLFCLISQLTLSVLCMRNVTVDDNDPSIQYTDGWGQATPTDLDHGGVHTLTTNTSAQALFNFTGEHPSNWITLTLLADYVSLCRSRNLFHVPFVALCGFHGLDPGFSTYSDHRPD